MKKFRIFRPVFDKVLWRVFDRDRGECNLLVEDGFALLQEDGSLIKL